MSVQVWHIITCEYPPQIGGVAAYARQIATALVRAGGSVHVWAPGTAGDTTEPDGILVHRTLGGFSLASCAATGRRLNAFPRRRLFVQWVPHGYGWKSLNLPFAAWLAWRAWMRGDELQVMVHEPYMRVTWPPSHLVASLVEQLMLWMLGVSASRVWLSTPSWEPYVRPFTRRRTPVAWLAIPAPDAAPAREPATPGGRVERKGSVVGHFSTHSPVVTSILGPALVRVLLASEATVLLMGRDSERYRDTFAQEHPELAARVTATGVLSIDQVAARMRDCDLMLQPFPDGITTRNTSMLLALASGVCVVSNTGLLTEALWRDTPAVALAPDADPDALGTLTLGLLADAARRQALADSGHRLYAERFDVERGAAMLAAAAAADTPGANRASHAEA